MKRPVTQSSSGASARSNPTLPTPPTRARQHPVRHISREVQRQQPPSDSQRRPSRQASGDLQRQQLLHNDTSQPQPRPVNRQGSSGPHLLGQNSNELGDEIHQLFGGPKPAQSQSKPAPGPKVENEFVADWLSHPAPAVDVAQPVRTDSVYVPVGLSKDRPTIPKGGLAPAPPPKAKSSPMVASPAQMSTGANKWADRLRAKR
jgi:hypothetical protein